MAPATAAARRSPASTHPARPRPRRAPAPARRVSGPARGRGAAAAAPAPFVLRAAGAVHALAEHRLLDRLIRGRMWIAILAVGLIGIVFMQVSMLRLNAGIGQAIERATTLERQNAGLQASISQLSSGRRIQDIAAQQGMVAPAGAAGIRFLDARRLDLGRAVRGITVPSSTPPAAPLTASLAAVVPSPAAPATVPPAGASAPGSPAAVPPAGASAPAAAAPAAAAAAPAAAPATVAVAPASGASARTVTPGAAAHAHPAVPGTATAATGAAVAPGGTR